MMREREPLKPNAELQVVNHEGGQLRFVVEQVSGFGGSCIAYDGYYKNNAGKRHRVKIKECYPYHLSLEREPSGALIVLPEVREQFERQKESIRKAFDIANELHETLGLRNVTSNVCDRYEANETVYMVSSYEEGNCMAEAVFETLKDLLRAVRSTAKSIERLHKQGCLYLDLKPDNVFVYPETPELIRLFDFDSVIPLDGKNSKNDFRVACSPGFAPVEQRLGKVELFGCHTDVYSIGALLFYLLFGRPPGALDCGSDAEYDYDQWKWDEHLQEKAYESFTVFFRNTLQSYYKDRYATMEEVVVQLEEILKYVDLPVPVICSTAVSQYGDIVGRIKERQRLSEWFQGENQVFFVSGMGGIGKSTIVRKFISKEREQFDHVVYLQFRESLKDTLADDTQFIIHGCEKDEAETRDQYVSRKLNLAKELAAGSKALLVIDNFDGVLDESFRMLEVIGWKILAVTRGDMSHSGYACEVIEQFSEAQQLRQLFEAYLGRRLNAKELPIFENLVERSVGHTLILVLLAKQISKSYLSLDEALRLMTDGGFSQMAPEKINYEQDGNCFYGKISALLKAIYDTSKLSLAEQQCLKILSLFDAPGIPVREAARLLELPSLDLLNELQETGWLEIWEANVSMHPLIRETIHQMAWTEECRVLILKEMQELFRIIDRKGKQGPKRGDEEKRIVSVALTMAKSILRHCKKDEKLWAEMICKDLMFVTLKNLPKDQEDYIIFHASLLFHDMAYPKPWAQMELYDYVVYLLCQKEDYTKAKRYLQEAYALAKKRSSHYLWGLYYDTQADFFDAMLDGAYDPGNTEEEVLLGRMVHSLDLAIAHMRKTKYKKGRHLFVKYMLGKAAILIRSTPEQTRSIRNLMEQAKQMIKESLWQDLEIRFVYHLVRAWYYTLCEPKETLVAAHLKEGKKMCGSRDISGLEMIDDYWIPAANMMWELGKGERAIAYLKKGIQICEEHGKIEPYQHKKQDLLSYVDDVCEDRRS